MGKSGRQPEDNSWYSQLLSGEMSAGNASANELKLQMVFEHVPIGLMHFDRTGIITSCNGSLAAMLGTTREALLGVDLLGLTDQRIVRLVGNALQGEMSAVEGGYTSAASGRKIRCKMSLQPVQDLKGQVLGGVGIVEDITRHREYEKHLQYLSQKDPVTDLYNRSFFEGQLETLNASLFKEQIVIIICDIDNLKLINDTMGHQNGDRLLQETARIITRSSSPDSLIARIGGDEFAILSIAGGQEGIDSFRLKLRENIKEHNQAQGDIPISLSYGYAISRENQTDLKALMREADLSMYRQKITQRHKNKEFIVQSFMRRLENFDALIVDKSKRLRKYLIVFGDRLELSRPALNYALSLADYHDIGRISIKNHPEMGRLARGEGADGEIDRHCEIGCRIALASEDTAILANAILKHHESWDGTGYPLGLKGEEIPLECRVFAVADACDEIVHAGAEGMDKDQLIKRLRAMAGKRLDPGLTSIFIQLLREEKIKIHGRWDD